ncbi:MAG: dockerin type I domain-containing protein [Methanosarcinaceae archaeon]
MNNRTNMGLVRVSIILSILLALSGTASALQPNQFYGAVTLNGADAPTETIINAYIGEELRGSIMLVSAGEYGYDMNYLDVSGDAGDNGTIINFTVCGAVANETAIWYEDEPPLMLNLTAEDYEAPAVTNATATPASIVANGNDTTQLNVTVIDGCTVGNVTVNLSAIGGDAAQAMDRIGDTDVYSVITNATEGTALGAYCLPVNASDGLGNYNTSVCIALEVTMPGLPKNGDINGDGTINTLDAIHLAKYYTGAGSEKFRTIFADGDINSDGSINTLDAIHLAKYYTGAGSEKFRTIYP